MGKEPVESGERELCECSAQSRGDFFFFPAHTGAVLLHSILSCGVMDLLPAAYGPGCTESARALFPPQSTQNILKYMQANAVSSVHHSKVEYL